MAKKKEVVIIGAGAFGQTIAKKLSTLSRYRITVIDKNRDRVDSLNKWIDVGIVGNAAEGSFLADLGIEATDYFIIAISGEIGDSIVISSTIKGLFLDAKIIAEAKTLEHQRILKGLKVDSVVTPPIEGARTAIIEIVNPLIGFNSEGEYYALDDEISFIKIPTPNEWHNKKVKDIKRIGKVVIALIERKDKTIGVVKGNTTLRNNEMISIIGKDDDIISLLDKLATN